MLKQKALDRRPPVSPLEALRKTAAVLTSLKW